MKTILNIQARAGLGHAIAIYTLGVF